MLVYSDTFTKDEVISDSFRQEAPFGQDALKDVAFEIASRRIQKGTEDFGISANVDEDAEAGTAAEGCEGGATVVDIVDNFGLEEYSMSKADFKVYIKGYMGNLIKHLESAKPDRVAAFKTGVMSLVKKVLEEWDSCEIYMSKNYLDYACENKSLPIIAYYKGEETAPRFIFMRDGLDEEKC